MADFGDTFRSLKKLKTSDQHVLPGNLQLLTLRGIPYRPLEGTEVEVGDYVFDYASGAYRHKSSGYFGRGVFSLVKRLSGKENPLSWRGKK